MAAPHRKLLAFELILLAALLSSACSPWYVMRAGWEEAGILARRQPIDTLIRSKNTDIDLKRKLMLVAEARKFAESLDLSPGESFTQYSSVDREVLVWVLSASSKTSLEPKTWWFPIVGSVPYKGFFDKEDGLSEAKELSAECFDAYLRPSPAYSTLGWFNDPVLSTTLQYSDEAIVNTVIHEIVHSTVWINGHVSFNETFANVFAGLAAPAFFEQLGSEKTRELELDIDAEALRQNFQKQLRYAAHLATLRSQLQKLYQLCKDVDCDCSDEVGIEVLRLRDNIFRQAQEEWLAAAGEDGSHFSGRKPSLNNSIILAQSLYLDRPQLFMKLYEKKGNSLKKLIDEIRFIEKNVNQSDSNPYELLKEIL